MNAPVHNIAALILAAGNSSRLGHPKQLLLYQDQPLLRRAAQSALDAGCSPVIIILGANAPQILPTLRHLSVEILHNDDWPRGIGTSLRLGVTHLLKLRNPPASLLLLLSDQPLITSTHLHDMITMHRASHKQITAAAYNQTLGVPIVIQQPLFPALQTLPDSSGAKSLLGRYPQDITPFPLPEAATDIDDEAAYNHLVP